MSSKDLWLDVNDLVIRYRVHRSIDQEPRARMLILPGFTEFVEKHVPTMARLADIGLESLVLDWPGQGRSTRLTDYADTLIHSDGFEQHLACLNAVADREGFTDDGGVPLFLLGHSMGAFGHAAGGRIYAPLCRGCDHSTDDPAACQAGWSRPDAGANVLRHWFCPLSRAVP